jgi:hypothetical protein
VYQRQKEDTKKPSHVTPVPKTYLQGLHLQKHTSTKRHAFKRRVQKAVDGVMVPMTVNTVTVERQLTGDGANDSEQGNG